MHLKTPVLEFGYYGEVLGTFQICSGGRIEWQGRDHPYRYFFDGESANTPPRLLKNLAPEGWLNGVLNSPDPVKYIGEGIRFLSNITIAPDTDCLYRKIDGDRVHVSLDACTDKTGVFTGTYGATCPTAMHGAFELQLASYWKNPLMPKFSGVQMKLPTCIYPVENGDTIIMPAAGASFSHILKLPGTAFHEPIAALEWMGLEMAERAGLKAAKHALVPLEGGLPPALIVERFDIPTEETSPDKRMLIADFLTLTGADPSRKYGTSAETLAKKLKEISTDLPRDAVEMFNHNAFAWFSGDCDMHMKNLSVLKEFDHGTGKASVNLAPVYDTLPTIVLPSKGDQSLSLPIGGKTSGLKASNFVNFGRSLGLDEETSLSLLKEVAEKTAKAAVDLAQNPPKPIVQHEKCLFAVKHAATEIVDRVRAFGFDVPEWDPVRPDKDMRKEMRRYAQEHGPSLAMV